MLAKGFTYTEIQNLSSSEIALFLATSGAIQQREIDEQQRQERMNATQINQVT